MLGSLLLLLLVSVCSCQITDKEKQFKRSIEYWTEALCILQKTKTIVFHGISGNKTRASQEFFDVLLYTTSEYCGAVVLLKIYTLPEFPRDHSSSMGNSNTLLNNVHTDLHVRMGDRNAVRRQAMCKSGSMVNLRRPKRNKIQRRLKNDEDYTNMWTVNVIFIGDVDTFEMLLDSDTHFQWNSREQFIMLAVWNDPLAELTDRRPLIDRTLRKFWQDYHIHNVYFDEPLSDRENFNFYSYNPFAMNNESGTKIDIYNLILREEVTEVR